MAMTKDLLIELGTEELPPRALGQLITAFEQGIAQGLQQAELSFTDIVSYATPRRLAVVVTDLQTKQPDRVVERRGPAVSAAFDETGNPSKALRGFASSCGVKLDQLDTLNTEKGSWLVYKQQQSGTQTASLIEGILVQTLNDLPSPKRMRWGNLPGDFVRPVHWLIVLFGEDVVPMEILGVKADRFTLGHRFHHPQAIHIRSARTYAPQLETEGHVLVDFKVRRETIRNQVIALANELGGEAVINPDLLDEVTGLVEWPVALAGNFDARFLQLPAEVLISTMQSHQKYFALRRQNGKLLAHFITISNLISQDPAQVIAGNERVILPRLSDAAFFWQADCKQTLAERLEQLKSIVFQNQLGSVYDKSLRVVKLAGEIAQQIGGDVALAERAALLAKCDLMSEMVGEFPELQGIMGRYYARLDGEHDEVAEALDEQYRPRFAGDVLPQTQTGQALSLAEKLDTLTGLFGIGQPPSGVKDPFALRRAALGVLRIVIESQLDVDLATLLNSAEANFDDRLSKQNVTASVMQYFYERLRGYALEQGAKADEFEAVLAVKPSRPLDFVHRLRAVAEFRKLDQAESLTAGNKRIDNILRKNEMQEKSAGIDEKLLAEPAEKALAEKVKLALQLDSTDYTSVLNYLAGLREAIDAFFDEVMVMTEDEALRNNRLALLNQTRLLFLAVADISCLQS